MGKGYCQTVFAVKTRSAAVRNRSAVFFLKNLYLFRAFRLLYTKRGDTLQDFEVIFKNYASVVFRFLLSLCGDENLAEELTSETFYQAYLHIERFRGDCKIETWLCQIAKNALYKEQKRRKRFADPEQIENAAADGNFFELISDKEQAIKIHKALHTLGEPYHEVFMLRVFGDLSFKEIADVCGKSESWAKVTFYRAKNKIIESLEGKI